MHTYIGHTHTAVTSKLVSELETTGVRLEKTHNKLYLLHTYRTELFFSTPFVIAARVNFATLHSPHGCMFPLCNQFQPVYESRDGAPGGFDVPFINFVAPLPPSAFLLAAHSTEHRHGHKPASNFGENDGAFVPINELRSKRPDPVVGMDDGDSTSGQYLRESVRKLVIPFDERETVACINKDSED